MKKTTVVYHSADFDGIFCCEIARKFMPDSELIGWNFGETPLQVPDGKLYVMDLPLDAPFGGKCGQFNMGIVMAEQEGRLVWIDHHASAIKSHAPQTSGYRIDGVAACRLAWQWFQVNGCFDPFKEGPRPTKEDFIQRRVSEPFSVRLAGEYDIWDKRDPLSETFQYSLRCVEKVAWEVLLQDNYDGRFYVETLLDSGRFAQIYARQTDASICNSRTWLMNWEGLKFLCVNSARFNSLLFAARDIPETGHDALLGFCFDGKCWTVSLYHSNHRKDVDLSQIAVKHGGGGHKGACGFTCDKLPF